MGLLEDAIREHLDLKRQHGADPSEVAAEEREALGPVQRAAEPAVVEDEDVEGDSAPPHDEPPEPAADEHDVALPNEDEEPYEEPPPPPPSDQSAPFDFEDEPFAPEPAQKPEEEAKADEDVLEETPEFLEDTPEHDRLWFEQKPPRDFDFDR
jgi:hypothetical protein